MSASGPGTGQEPGGGVSSPPPWGIHEGKLLVARPGMPDGRFRRSVILLVEHSERGAFGLMLNPRRAENASSPRCSGASVSRRLGGDMGRVDIHYGGPVSPDTGFVLHTTGARTRCGA